MEAIKFEMDTKAIQQWLAAWKKFPYQSGKWVNKMVNDMAFEFKEEFPKVIASRYTIRDPGFIRNIIRVKKAKPSRHMSKIAAIAYTHACCCRRIDLGIAENRRDFGKFGGIYREALL